MLRLATCASLLAAAAALTAPAAAHADASMEFHIVAQVDVFCRITAPETALDLSGGAAAIGAVQEVCNTPTGYVVDAQLSNVVRGELDEGLERVTLDDTGFGRRISYEPAAQTTTWRVAQAQVREPSLPVFMRVTITPR